ncbi:hypothetical protein LZE20_08415, partial [Lactobacillus jensenii]|nr:hypothetical protein [Lactobacillus jensenii]
GKGVWELEKVPDIPQDTHPNCRCAISAHWVDEDKIKEADKKEYIIGESGAIRKEAKHIDEFEPTLPGEDIAKALYLEFAQRDKNSNIEKIANAANLSSKDAEKIYNHIFIDKHLTKDLDGTSKMAYFDPNFSMAQSFQRIFNGQELEERDKIMLKHELYESKLMTANSKLPYIEAHALANKKYNYEKLTRKGE